MPSSAHSYKVDDARKKMGARDVSLCLEVIRRAGSGEADMSSPSPQREWTMRNETDPAIPLGANKDF